MDIKKKIVNFNIGIIGFGSLGKKRAQNLGKGNLLGIYDNNKSQIKNKYRKLFKPLDELLNDHRINLVIIATTHNYLAELTIRAIKSGKHVLVEKPGGINSKEILKIQSCSFKYKKFVKIGFNHRYHPSIIKAEKICKTKTIGKILYIRGNYGHGGRLGYEKEWRFNKKLSGGGELIDQGVHLIDLSSLFISRFNKIEHNLKSYFWKSKVEDNCFLTLENRKKQVAFLQASCTEWKNKFNFEIYGQYGKIEISGLGRSYGIEKIILYKMKKKMGIPNMKSWVFNEKNDISWVKEISDFYNLILNHKFARVQKLLRQNVENMKILDKIYNKTNL